MRFLIGLFTGAVLTLLVATAMDAPTHPILSKTRDLAHGIWDRLITSTSDSLFDARSLTEPLPDESGPAELMQSAAAVEEAAKDVDPFSSESVELPVLNGLQLAAAEPAMALPPPDPVDTQRSGDFETENISGIEDIPVDGFAEDGFEVERAGMENTFEPHAPSPVWVPFHSQMSAEGFATRLSQALDREFRVERQGAGAYQVVFDAADAVDQTLVLTRVSEITGQ